MPESKKSLLHEGGQRKHSISRALTVALILMVVVVSTVTVFLNYLNLSQKTKIQLEEKANEYITSLAGVLEIPLWNLDELNVKRIGEAYAQNELFEKLKFTDNMGNVFFDYKRENSSPLVRRVSQVLHQGQTVGSVEISLTAKYYTEANRQLLLSAISALFVIIAVLVLSTGFLLRMLLNKPLNRLGDIANACASGRYDFSEHDISFVEFHPLVCVLNEMADKISSQMTELRNAEKKYRSIFENAVEGIFQTSPKGQILHANPAMARILGYDSADELTGSVPDIRQLHVEPERREEFIRMMKEGKAVSGFHIQLFRKDRHPVWVSLHARPVFDKTGELSLMEGILEDITEYKRAEAEHAKLEDQLRHSQRMEAVGLLAGGIAHDFNNLLTPILGYSELLIADFSPDDPRRQKLQQVKQAAERAKEMTHRLLAFSRKQIIELKIVDLGSIISQFENMLRRTIRENITIEVGASPSLSLVHADAGQIEQVLLNLSINAQDAMPEGGTLTIEAVDIDLDESYTSSHPEVVPGEYVMLAVSDTGIGMDEETKVHVFDPFFTTKETGKGTGLGLSSVYGVVKQHGGSISVYSEKNQGSTFKIFLPRIVKEGVTIKDHKPLPEEVAYGHETILVVEDDEMVKILASTMLQDLGYEVLVAENPEHCTKLVREHKGPVNLLLTDVVMPGMNGRDLAEQLCLLLPDLKVLYMSGYTNNVIVRHGVLHNNVHFIQKPFSVHTLSQKIRHALAS
jgi:two-component system, cell cycle sensor histidine kinase and response regulator CckA